MKCSHLSLLLLNLLLPAMDSPSLSATAARETNHTETVPASALDKLDPIELDQIRTEIATELFGFAPLTFTSRVVDLANEVIYDVIDKVEEEVSQHWISENNKDEKESKELESRVAKVRCVQQNTVWADLVWKIQGVNRLETLLMSAVDLRFDQAETWIIRNTFKVPTELLPYVLLPHHPQEGFTQYSEEGLDDALFKSLEQGVSDINALREESTMLEMVEERYERRLAVLKQAKSTLSELLTAGGTRGGYTIILLYYIG